jgi:hypothetical protein
MGERVKRPPGRVVLSGAGYRVFWPMSGGPPLWLVRRGWHWVTRFSGVTWSRVGIPGEGAWWHGQCEDQWVLVGFNPRPRLALIQEGWVGLVPLGRGPIRMQLPSDAPCTVWGWDHSTWAAPVNGRPRF